MNGLEREVAAVGGAEIQLHGEGLEGLQSAGLWVCGCADVDRSRGVGPECCSGWQAGSQADQGTITLKQEVRNVVIDVVVTDKHGHPLKSLPEGRFKVFENGVPQQIAFFEEHNDNEEAAAPSTPGVEELPSDVHTNVESVAANGPLMVLLLDALNTRPDQQSYVHAQVMDYLKKLRPGTRIAIFTLGNKLQADPGIYLGPAGAAGCTERERLSGPWRRFRRGA